MASTFEHPHIELPATFMSLTLAIAQVRLDARQIGVTRVEAQSWPDPTDIETNTWRVYDVFDGAVLCDLVWNGAEWERYYIHLAFAHVMGEAQHESSI